MKIYRPKGRIYNGIYLPPLAGGVDMFTTDQSHFQIYEDVGAQGSAPPHADEDINASNDVDVPMRLRFTCQETGNVGGDQDFRIQRNLLGGGWVTVETDTAVILTLDSTRGNYNDGDDTANILSGTGTFIAGEVVTGEFAGPADTNFAIAIPALGNTEIEFVIKMVSDDVANGDTIDFRMVSTMSGLLDNYSVTPTITVIKGSAARKRYHITSS